MKAWQADRSIAVAVAVAVAIAIAVAAIASRRLWPSRRRGAGPPPARAATKLFAVASTLGREIRRVRDSNCVALAPGGARYGRRYWQQVKNVAAIGGSFRGIGNRKRMWRKICKSSRDDVVRVSAGARIS